MKQFNQLSSTQSERLALLLRESGNVIQTASRVLMDGYDAHNPEVSESMSNRKLLEKEIGRFINAVSMLGTATDIDLDECEKHTAEARKTITGSLHHNTVAS